MIPPTPRLGRGAWGPHWGSDEGAVVRTAAQDVGTTSRRGSKGGWGPELTGCPFATARLPSPGLPGLAGPGPLQAGRLPRASHPRLSISRELQGWAHYSGLFFSLPAHPLFGRGYPLMYKWPFITQNARVLSASESSGSTCTH